MLGSLPRWAHAACASSLLVGLGCVRQDSGPAVALHFGHIPKALDGTCSSETTPTSDILGEIDSFRLRVSGPGMKTREASAATADTLEVDKVPAGAERKVLVTGLKGGQIKAWRGFTTGVEVEAGKTTDVSVLLTKVADVTCGRNAMTNGRAFQTATPLPDGRVLIVGGIERTDPATDCFPASTGCQGMTATDSADIFDPTTGTFTSAGYLANGARAFHTAAALPDGRVVILGGARFARVNPAAPFPIVIAPGDTVSSVEVFDPVTSTFTDLGGDPGSEDGSGRAFAAAMTLPNGMVLFTGGTPSLYPDSTVKRIQAWRSSAVCFAEAAGSVVCKRGPDMVMRRAGHTMIELLDGSVLVYGGSIETGQRPGNDDDGNPRNVSEQAPETYRVATSFDDLGEFMFEADRPRFVDATGYQNNLFFTSSMRVKNVGVFFVGGLVPLENSTSESFTLQAPNADVWFLEEGQRFMSTGTTEQPFQLAVPRYFVQLAELGDGARWVVAGGFTGNPGDFQPSDALEFYDRAQGDFRQIKTNNEPKVLRQVRGGLTATTLPSGTALLVGGRTRVSNGDAKVADTAEIFTDPTEPSP